MIICISGFPGSGKSTVGSELIAMGFRVLEVSSTIKDKMTEEGVEIDPKSIEEYTGAMKAKYGKGVFARATAQKVRDSDKDVAIIGMRSVEELNAVRETIGSKIPFVLLTAPKSTRYKRLSERPKLPIKSYSVFMMRETSNIDMGIGELTGHADFIIANSGTKEELKAALSDVLDMIRNTANPK
jgi:dephospho-CoA kinase